MENMRINVRQAHSDTYNGNPYIAFAGIMTGLLSVILFVELELEKELGLDCQLYSCGSIIILRNICVYFKLCTL